MPLDFSEKDRTTELRKQEPSLKTAITLFIRERLCPYFFIDSEWNWCCERQPIIASEARELSYFLCPNNPPNSAHCSLVNCSLEPPRAQQKHYQAA